jgi:putative ATP-binding cassette transporter
MYCLLVDELPQVTLVSVAHRNSVAKYHQSCWRFSRAEENQPARMSLSPLPVAD